MAVAVMLGSVPTSAFNRVIVVVDAGGLAHLGGALGGAIVQGDAGSIGNFSDAVKRRRHRKRIDHLLLTHLLSRLVTQFG